MWQAPPGWPRPPDGWVPGPGWAPDPGWPPAPQGWQWWRFVFVKIDEPPWYRRVRIAGGVAVALFVLGMLALFPFVYGDPLPGTTKETPGWFLPVAWACNALLIVGVALLLAPPMHKRRKQPPMA